MAGMGSMLRNFAGKASAFGKSGLGKAKSLGRVARSHAGAAMNTARGVAAMHPKKALALGAAGAAGAGYAAGRAHKPKQQFAQGGYLAMHNSTARGARAHVPTMVTLKGQAHPHSTAFTAGGKRKGDTADVGKYAHGGRAHDNAGYDQHEAGEDRHDHDRPHGYADGGGMVRSSDHDAAHFAGASGRGSADVSRRGGIRVKDWHGNVGYKDGGSGEVEIHIDQVRGTHNVDEDDKYAHGGRVEEHFGAHGSRAGNAAKHAAVMHAAGHPDLGARRGSADTRSQMNEGQRQTYKGQGPQYKHGGRIGKKRRYADGGMTGGRRHAMPESRLRDYC